MFGTEPKSTMAVAMLAKMGPPVPEPLPPCSTKRVITLLVEHGGSGSGTGGPILAKLANAMVDLGYVPNKTTTQKKETR